MLVNLFYWLLNISISASLGVGLVLLVRKIKMLPRLGVYFLWLVVILRFWFPWGLANRYSLLNIISRYLSKTLVLWQFSQDYPNITITNFTVAASQYSPLTFKTELLTKLFSVSTVIWLVVALIALIVTLFFYFITKAEVKNACLVKENIYQSALLSSPAVYGIFKPRIILPQDIKEEDKDYVLTHERVHIKRLDNQWRILVIVTACIHWFNPLVWVALKCFLIDMELACDEAVLKKMGEGNSKNYATVLLSYSFQNRHLTSAFSGIKTGARIENILSYRRLTLFSTLCFVVFFLIIVVTLITNAVA